MMTFCRSCGSGLPEGAQFCERCGDPVPKVAEPAADATGPRVSAPRPTSPAEGVLARFWGFDRLIGSALVKLVYYTGMAVIGLVLALYVLSLLPRLSYATGATLGLIVLAVAVAAFVLIVWRYFCELAVLAYQIFNRLGEIRDRLPPPAGRAG